MSNSYVKLRISSPGTFSVSVAATCLHMHDFLLHFHVYVGSNAHSHLKTTAKTFCCAQVCTYEHSMLLAALLQGVSEVVPCTLLRQQAAGAELRSSANGLLPR